MIVLLLPSMCQIDWMGYRNHSVMLQMCFENASNSGTLLSTQLISRCPISKTNLSSHLLVHFSLSLPPSLFLSLSRIYPFPPISEMSFLLKCVVWLLKKRKGCCCIIDSENMSLVNVCSKEENRMKLNFRTLWPRCCFSDHHSLDIFFFFFKYNAMSLACFMLHSWRWRCANIHMDGRKTTRQLATGNIYIQQPSIEWAMFERTAVDGGYRAGWGVAAPFNV